MSDHDWIDAAQQVAKLTPDKAMAIERCAMERVDEVLQYLEKKSEGKFTLLEMCNICASMNRYVRDQKTAEESGEGTYIFDAAFIQAGIGALVMLAVTRGKYDEQC